jgi:hypothetical protein
VVSEADKTPKESDMTWMLMNIPLMILIAALTAGIPAWLVLKHPDQTPKPALAAPAVRTLPQAENENAARRRAA